MSAAWPRGPRWPTRDTERRCHRDPLAASACRTVDAPVGLQVAEADPGGRRRRCRPRSRSRDAGWSGTVASGAAGFQPVPPGRAEEWRTRAAICGWIVATALGVGIGEIVYVVDRVRVTRVAGAADVCVRHLAERDPVRRVVRVVAVLRIDCPSSNRSGTRNSRCRPRTARCRPPGCRWRSSRIAPRRGRRGGHRCRADRRRERGGRGRRRRRHLAPDRSWRCDNPGTRSPSGHGSPLRRMPRPHRASSPPSRRTPWAPSPLTGLWQTGAVRC